MTRARKRRERPADEDVTKHAQILEQAAKLFRRHGYAATTLRQIADATGIMAGSIYYHFSSKEEILVEVLDAGIRSVFSAVREKVDALPARATNRERIAAAIEGHLYGLLHHGDFTSANIRIYGQIPQSAKDRHRPVRLEYAGYWDRLFADGQRSRELRSDIPVSVMRLFVLGSLNFTVEWYNPNRGSFESFALYIAALVFDGILKPGAAPRHASGRLRRVAETA